MKRNKTVWTSFLKKQNGMAMTNVIVAFTVPVIFCVAGVYVITASIGVFENASAHARADCCADADKSNRRLYLRIGALRAVL